MAQGNNTAGLLGSTGWIGLLYVAAVLICIGVSWWALQAFRFDLFVRNPKGLQAKLLQVLLSIVVGYQLAKFLIDYTAWSLARITFSQIVNNG